MIIEHRDQAERAKQRKALGTLKELTVKLSTKKRYDKAVCASFNYLARHQVHLPKHPELVDEILSGYVEDLWESGESRYLAADTVCGLQYHQPTLRRKLVQSWQALKTWSRLEVPARAPPLTPHTLDVLSGALHLQGPSLGLAAQVAFRGLLRTGELLAVKAADIMFAHNNAKAFVQLHESKTMRTNPATRLVAISDYKVVTLLRAWKASVPGSASLVPMPPHQFRKAYGLALANANLGSYGFKPYSLRRDGATELFLTCHSFSTVTQHGQRGPLESTFKIPWPCSQSRTFK